MRYALYVEHAMLPIISGPLHAETKSHTYMYLYVEHVYIIMESIMYLHAETKYYIYIVDIHFEICIIC